MAGKPNAQIIGGLEPNCLLKFTPMCVALANIALLKKLHVNPNQ